MNYNEETLIVLAYLIEMVLEFVFNAILAYITLRQILIQVCRLFCYRKMGEPEWAALIPFYSDWVLCQNVWGHGAFMFFAFIPFGGLAFRIATNCRLYKVFGRTNSFCVFGVFFPMIATAICAFRKSIQANPKR